MGSEESSHLSLVDIPLPGALQARVGDYELLEMIAHGGMGVVYKARQRSLNRTVALKMLLGGVHASQEFKRRFRQEAETVAQLQHPNIVPIYEIGEQDGQPYFSMEFVEGCDLARLIDAQPLAPQTAAEYVKTVAEAVAYAHSQGVLHRDLKPSNILIGSDNRPRVTDFGLACQTGSTGNLTLTGATLGTPSYLPPEQASVTRGQVERRSDVYSLGAVLYHLLTGRPPFLAGSAVDTLRQVLEAEPAPLRQLNPAVPCDLETISLKCLSKLQSQRYASASDLAEDLGRWLEGKTIAARPTSILERAAKWARRRPAVALLLGLLLAVGVSGIAGILWQWRQAMAARFRAEQASLSSSNAMLRLKLEMAENRADEGRYGTQLSYLAGVLRSQPTNRVAIERALSALGHRNYLVPSCQPMMHMGCVLDVEFSPDGHRLATGSTDCGAFVYDADTGSILAGPMNHKGAVTLVHFSPDSRRLLSCSGETVARLWNVEPGPPGKKRLLAELGGHSQPVDCAEFDASGARALTASSDGAVQIWELSTPPRLLHHLAHQGPVSRAVFSPDGRRVLTASADGTAQLWSALDGTRICPALRHPGPVTYCAFSPDGRMFSTISGTSVFLWNGEMPTSQPVTIAHRSTVSRMAFSPDGARVVTATRAELRVPEAVWIWGVNNTNCSLIAGPLHHDSEVTAVDFSPDGLTLLTASRDGALRLWEGHTGALLAEAASHKSPITNARFSPDGCKVASASRDKFAVLWSVALGRPDNLWFKHEGNVLAMDIHPDGRTLLAATSGGLLCLWDATTGRLLQEPWRHPGAVQFARFVCGGEQVMTAAADRRLRAWEVKTGKLLAASPAFPEPLELVDFTPAGERAAVITGMTNVVVLDARDGFAKHLELSHHRNVQLARLDISDRRVVTGDEDGVGRIWDAETGALLKDGLVLIKRDFTSHPYLLNVLQSTKPDATELSDQVRNSSSNSSTVSLSERLSNLNKIEPIWSSLPTTNIAILSSETVAYFEHAAAGTPGEELFGIEFSPDSRLIAAAYGDGQAQLWEAGSGHALHGPMKHAAAVSHIEFSPDGSRVATSSLDFTTRVWDTASGAQIGQLLRHPAPVLFAHFSPDGSRIVTAALNNTLRVWDVETGLPLTDPLAHPSSIRQALFSNDGQRLVSCSQDCYLRVWEIPSCAGPAPSPFIALVEALAGGDNLADGAVFRGVSQLFDVAEQRRRSPGTNFYGRYAQWMLEDASTNPITDSSQITRGNYLARLLTNNDLLSLEQLVRMCPTNALAAARLASALAARNQAANPYSGAEAQSLIRMAVRLAPHDPEALRINESFGKQQ